MSHHNFDTFSIHQKSNVAVLSVREKRIYMNTSEKFKDEIDQFLQSRPDKVVVDLSNVSVMNSAALGALIALQNDVEKRAGKLSVTGLQPLMEEIFYRMRLELLFDIDTSLDHAIHKLSGTVPK